MSTPENPSAFPVNTTNEPNPGAYEADPGMTLRDWFAGQALVGLLSSGKWDNCGDGFEAYIADRSGLIADAMLAERAKVAS